MNRGAQVRKKSAQADDVSPNMLDSSVKKFGKTTKSSVKITELMEKNKVERVGSDRSGFWKILAVDR